METFTFAIIWIGGADGTWFQCKLMKMQIHRAHGPGGECIDRLLTIQDDRDLAKGQCIGAGGYILPTVRSIQICGVAGLSCRWMMPERKRVICGFAACWQGGKRIS